MFAIQKPNILVTKNRDFGETPFILCSYDPANRHIFETATGDKLSYSWDHTDIDLPECPASSMPEFNVQEGKPPATGQMPTF